MSRLKAIVVGTFKSAIIFSGSATVILIAVGQGVKRKQLTPEDQLDTGIFGALLGGSLTLAIYHLRKRRRNRQHRQADEL